MWLELLPIAHRPRSISPWISLNRLQPSYVGVWITPPICPRNRLSQIVPLSLWRTETKWWVSYSVKGLESSLMPRQSYGTFDLSPIPWNEKCSSAWYNHPFGSDPSNLGESNLMDCVALAENESPSETYKVDVPPLSRAWASCKTLSTIIVIVESYWCMALDCHAVCSMIIVLKEWHNSSRTSFLNPRCCPSPKIDKTIGKE